jgi:signal transduction histidine kinase
MSIRTRLTFWFGGILGLSLVILSAVLLYEWEEQQHRILKEGKPPEPAWHEVGEIVAMFGIPTAALLVIGGSILLRKSLAPVVALTRAAESIHLDNLRQRLPLTGSGDELDRLTEVFNSMITRLEASVTQVREFTLNASHELKTPLTVMRTQIESAMLGGTVPPAHRELLASQLEEIQRLTKIVNSLMFLAKADAEQVQLQVERLRLDVLVHDAAADAEMLGRTKGTEVDARISEPVWVMGDRNRLRQLLLNLTDNALKYNSSSGGKIQIQLVSANGSAELIIANSGPGIPREKLSRVFQRFYRCDDSHSSEVEGCGLGLSIVQWITKAHEGTVTIDSQPGKLTVVTVRLPVASGA